MKGNPSDQANVAWERLPWKKMEVAVYRMQKRMCAMRRIEISLV
jgi:hypothetical protein